MSDTEETDWRDEEAQALRTLAEREAALPPELKSKVVGRLDGLGLLAAKPSGRASTWAPWAAAAALALLSFAAGRGSVTAPVEAPPPGTRYVLLLTGAGSVTPEENEARRHEYGAWLQGLQGRGMLADGAELVTPRHDLPGNGRHEPVVGYFIISVKDEREALGIARSNPHLRHGGGVTLAALR